MSLGCTECLLSRRVSAWGNTQYCSHYVFTRP
jgi:hypothetical protein